MKATVEEVESQEGGHLTGRLKKQTDDVGAEEAPVNPAFVLIEFTSVFCLPVLPVGHVQGHQQGRRGHHDELQRPEPHLRDGEEVVEAGVFTAGLLGVTHEILLLILPHLLCRRHVHQDAKQEEDREPNAADDRGVFVDSTKDIFQKSPVHFAVSVL